jgi:hypothetical protein
VIDEFIDVVRMLQSVVCYTIGRETAADGWFMGWGRARAPDNLHL